MPILHHLQVYIICACACTVVYIDIVAGDILYNWIYFFVWCWVFENVVYSPGLSNCYSNYYIITNTWKKAVYLFIKLTYVLSTYLTKMMTVNLLYIYCPQQNDHSLDIQQYLRPSLSLFQKLRNSLRLGLSTSQSF